MHEVSLVENILSLLRSSAAENNIKKINLINLVVGKFSMALPDSLQFAFEALGHQESLFSDAVLHIIEKQVECTCKQCHNQFIVEKTYDLSCPACGSPTVDILTGRELYIDSYEGE